MQYYQSTIRSFVLHRPCKTISVCVFFVINLKYFVAVRRQTIVLMNVFCG